MGERNETASIQSKTGRRVMKSKERSNLGSRCKSKETDINKLRKSYEKLEKELNEKTKIVQNLEVRLPEMISEFTKCVSDKDEVISAKDKEIKTHKQKKANLETDLKLLQNKNKKNSEDLAKKAKEEESLKKEITRNNKDKVEHLHKMDGLDA